ncbi:MAG: hypothetical protein KGO52_09955 [Nitrospirota bacterium]|nr:hypothetical protein [Nitrospirota bacterium]MDE3119684.1 hypothetical protein [Nitrospirota bacterium]MDE3224289.1 hypothetical protein [Nitrospirota bacterium]MDE3243029.1 hypothetical protein [Nitrospirota bacterium]
MSGLLPGVSAPGSTHAYFMTIAVPAQTDHALISAARWPVETCAFTLGRTIRDKIREGSNYTSRFAE